MAINKRRYVSLGVAITLFAFLYISGAFGSAISFGKISTNTDKEWRVSFKILYGTLKGFVKTDCDNSNIIILSDIKKGKVVFSIFDAKNNLIKSTTSNYRTDTIRNLRQGCIYRIEATAHHANGSFHVSLSDRKDN